MKETALCRLLGIEHPIIQAGMPWIANPELAAAVSKAGGLGVIAPTAGMDADGDVRQNLREALRRTQSMTDRPFGVACYLGRPEVADLLDIALQEGIRIVITFGGSPALYTGRLKDGGVTVLHMVASVRHARGAEARGVDAVIAEGFEGGGLRGWEEVPTFVLLPQVRDAVDIPVVASGGIADARGFAAALALGADGVQIGTRFAATEECIAHPRFKEAIISAVDTGTLVAGRYHIPTRVLKGDFSLKLKNDFPGSDAPAASWEEALGSLRARKAMLEGQLDEGIAYCGAAAGLVSEVVSASVLVQQLVKGAEAIFHSLR